MKSAAIAVLVVGLCALAANAAPAVKITATATGLDEEETAIVNGFLELVQGVVKAGGDIDKMQDVLSDIKARVEAKLKANGASYLTKLANTLSNVNISEDNVNSLIQSITNMADNDGVSLSRSKRSPKKKKKKKKGKKGCGK